MRWFWLLAAVPVILVFLKARRSARGNATLLIDSVVKNSLTNLGYEPDGASLTFLATHPFLSARIWTALGEAGATRMDSGPLSEQSELSCDQFLRYVRSPEFRKKYPCAVALMQYAVHISDRSPEQLYGCMHPKDEFEQKAKKLECSPPPTELHT